MAVTHLTKGTLGLVVLCVLAVGGIALASIPDGNGVIHGCYRNSSGHDLRVIDSPSESCTSNEVALNWNQTGPQGPAGAAGEQRYYTVSRFEALILQPSSFASTSVACDPGDVAVGGGYSTNNTGDLRVLADAPEPTIPEQWHFHLHNNDSVAIAVDLHARCADLPPIRQ